MSINHLVTAVLILIAIPVLGQGQTALKLEVLMSPQELHSTGIDSLEAAQLDALNQWLSQHLPALEHDSLPGSGEMPANDNTNSGTANQTGTPLSDPAVSAELAAAEVQAQTRGYGEREPFVEVVSLIKGPFTGWSGATVFELENGQVYQQRRQGKWRTELFDPEVRVRKNFLGMFEMEVDGHSIGVKRLR